jgi:hypothetical protein
MYGGALEKIESLHLCCHNKMEQQEQRQLDKYAHQYLTEKKTTNFGQQILPTRFLY